jgi:hypothetical protein
MTSNFHGSAEDAPRAAHAERGMALVFVLLAFVVLSVAAAAFMMVTNVETKVAGHNLRRSAALNIAEAGIAEAVARLRAGDIPDNGNPRMVAQIFLTDPGFVPVLGVDSIGLATQQPAGEWLSYSMPTRDSRVLQVRYKTDRTRTTIYRFDPTKNPAVQTATGMPIFVISSTGRKGNEISRLETECFMRPVNAFTKAALACEQGIDFSGNAFVCGYNHRTDVPSFVEDRGPCLGYETGSLDLPGAWSGSTVTTVGSSSQYGVPSPYVENQVGFYAGPWDALGMGQADFFSWIGAPSAIAVDPPRGIHYLDNDTMTQNVSGAFDYHGGNGEGLLYVDGDLELNGIFTFRGLVYVEGDIKINGTLWVLGGLIVKGVTRVKVATGDCAVLYSEETIRQKIARYGGDLVTLSWIENNNP